MYLLFIYGNAATLLDRVECRSVNYGRQVANSYKGLGLNVTCDLFSAEYSEKHGKYIPKELLHRYHRN